MDPDDLEPATLFWAAAAALLALAIGAAVGEYRRRRRRNLDRPGWVPWDLVQILAFLLAVVAAALALHV
jgi:peptidoglycan/LPS O-acetylase OafA/YrhL